MTIIEIITLVALFIGPISAVLITRWLDKRREVNLRKFNIFSALMQTRRMQISADHVAALNLVEIAFADDPKVLKACRDLFGHFNNEPPRRVNEQITESMNDVAKSAADSIYFKRMSDERQALLSKLLSAMGSNLGFNFEQLEIYEGGYAPQGWRNVEDEQAIVRRLLVDISTGKAALPVLVIDVNSILTNETEK